MCVCVQKSSSAKVPSRPEYGVIYVAQEYPPWQRLALVKLRELYNEVGVVCWWSLEGGCRVLHQARPSSHTRAEIALVQEEGMV